MSTPAPDWSLYRSFLAVLRDHSLSGAARSLNLTQPTLARHIAALEQQLGFELFTRSQQGLAPTEAALTLMPYAQSIEGNAAGLLRAASGIGQTVAGTVRITASEIMGAEVLPSMLGNLRQAHPGLEFELVPSNTVDNLLRRDADIAVRMVEPIQEALVVKKLGSVAVGLYAHKDYLKRTGKPSTVKDLSRHSMIGFDQETPALRAMRARMPAANTLHFAFRADSDIVQLQAIRAGFGIGFCQTGLAKREPALVRVLTDVIGLKLGVWLVMHENLRSTPRCRAVFDGLAAELSIYVDR